MRADARLAKDLSTLFQLRSGEGRRVALMFLYSMAAIGGVFIVARAVGRTLFLSTLSKAEISYKFLLPPLVIVVVISGYTRLATRYPSNEMMVGSNVLMVIVLLTFRLLLETSLRSSFGLMAALFVFTELMTSIVAIQFWTLASKLFDSREAKRLFGLIAAGGTLANIIAAAVLATLARTLASKNLIWVVITDEAMIAFMPYDTHWRFVFQ